MFKQKSKILTSVKRVFLLAILVIVTAASFVVAFSRQETARAATNSTINFQARLLTAAGNLVPDGDYNVEFKLYNALSSAGSSQGSCSGDSACLWTETRTTTNRVRTVNGYLTVNLGSVTAFPGINWDQELWLTMNIGGTPLSPSWDGEMNPRLKLTSVPYAFRAGTLVGGTGANTTTLNTGTPSGTNTIQLPAESGTICIQSSTACGFLTGSADDYIQNGTSIQAAANFAIRSAATGSVGGVIQGANGQTVDIFQVQTWNGTSATTALSVGSTGLVTASAGLTVSGNLGHSTGTISLASNSTASYTSTGATTITAGAASTWSTSSGALTIQSATTSTLSLRTGGAGTVAVGDTNTTTINIGRGSNIARTINIGNAGTSTAQAITIGSTGSTSATTVQGGTGATAINLIGGTNGSINITTAGTGDIALTSTDNIIAKATTSLQIQNASNSPLFYADTANGRVGIGGQATFSMFEVLGGDIAIYNSGNNPRLILGDSTAGGQNGYLQWDSTNDYFRIESVGTNGLKINDNFVAIGNIFPSQPLIVGNGSTNLFQVNTTGSVLGKTSTDSTTGFQIQDALSNPVFNVDTDNVRVGIGNNAPNYTLDVTGDVNISTGSSYRINGTAICTSSGCTPAAGSANYIQNQNASQQATSNFWISGTGRADTAFTTPRLDTAATGALTIGNTNATSILLGKPTGSNIQTAVYGQFLTQSVVDSTTVARVLNAQGNTVLNVDTTSPNLITNSSFESQGTTGWSAHGGASAPTQTVLAHYDNDAALEVAATAANHGARYNYALAASTQYSFSAFVRAATADFSTLQIGYSGDGSTDTSCATGQTAGFGRWVRLTCTFTTGAVSGTRYLYLKQTDATSRTWYVDAVQLEAAASSTPYRNGRVAISNSLIVNGGQLDAAASNAALQVNALHGGSGVKIYGSGENNIFQTTLDVRSYDDAFSLLSVSEATRSTQIQGGSGFFDTPALLVNPIDTGSVGLRVRGQNGQTASLLQVQTWNGSSATNVVTVGNTGLLTASAGLTVSGTTTLQGAFAMQPAADSTDVFNIKTSSGNNIFTVDTSNNRVGIGLGSNTVPTLSGAGIEISGAIRLSGLSGSIDDTYTSPLGSGIGTAINIANYDPGAFGQVIAMGLPSTAQSTARVITVLDARTVTHQPSLAVLSPDENQIGGFSWDGSNTNFRIKNSAAGSITLNVGGTDRITASNTGATVTGSLGQSGGTVSLAATGTASYTSTGATTITAAAASTWSTSTGNLTVQAATTSTLNLQTGGAGTVALGNVNTTTIDIGRGSNIARTIRIGDAGSSTAQTITIGSTGSTSSTTIQGGTGSTAINLTGGTNGSINLTASGTGNINLTAAANVIINTPTFSTATTQSCASNCTITQANVDGNGAVVINATAVGVTVALNDPTITTAGRIVYVTAAGASNDFTLSVNGGGTGNLIAMRANTSATMIWNGTDWTAAGASSSTTLQAAYDNTLASAGGAEIVLNNTATSNGLTIRNGSSNPIIGGGLLEVQTSIGTNLFSVNNNISELVANGGAEDSSTFSTNWQSYGTSTVTRNTTSGQYATGTAGAQFASTTANSGMRNNLATNPALSTNYLVSFTAKLASGSPAFTDLIVEYSPNGGTTRVTCIQNQTIVSTDWTRITCEVNTGGTAVSNADLLIYQVADPGAPTRTVYIDNLSMTLADDAGGIPNNVQIGGGIYGGAPTLFTLDRSSAPPVSNGNTTYLGSMYYDTTSGRIQCYESDGWGACGSAPDNIVTLTPEYSGAVLNGTGVGTMSADFCSNQAGVLSVNTSFCASGISRNFYRWTSPQASTQTYSIYVSYKLPNTFKSFLDANTVKLTALTDDMTDGQVGYEVFRSTGSAVTSCGSETIVTTPSADTWYQTSFSGDETACGFQASDNVIFKINVRARNNASVYVENLDFVYLNF